MFFSNLTEADLSRDDVKDSMMNDCYGIALDLRLRCNDWGFSLSEIKVPVHMQHSKTDDQVPYITAEMTAKLLPGCHLHPKEHGLHFSAEVLDDFIGTVIAPLMAVGTQVPVN